MADAPGFQSQPIVPYLAITGAAEAIEFYKAAFGAEIDGDVMTMPEGQVGHANLRIGDAYFMVSDSFPDWGVQSPADLGGSPVSIMLKVDDCGAATKRAVDAGATLEMEPTDQFWGNRDSRIVDPFGHRWNLAQQLEQLTPEQMAERTAEWQAEADGQ
jgi:PhnB protein